MKATKIVPPIPPNGELMPSALNSQPPMKAPTMPMTMSPMIPYPVPAMTSEARTPATRPTTIQASIPIVSVLERVVRPTARYGKRFQTLFRITKKERSDESAPFRKAELSPGLHFVLERVEAARLILFLVINGEMAIHTIYQRPGIHD